MRRSGEWMTLIDERILELLFSRGDLSLEDDLMKNEHFPWNDSEITVRCDVLSEYGLIRPSLDSDGDVYTITSEGISYLFHDLNADKISKQPRIPQAGKSASWMTEPDDFIIEQLATSGPLTEVELATRLGGDPQKFRDLARDRANSLSIRGLVRYLGQPDGWGERTYDITSFGSEYFEGKVSPERPRDYVDRIVDLSLVGPDDIRHRNVKFLASDSKYDIREHESRIDLKNQIWGVRCSDIWNLLRRFPRDPPLIDQCAFWMRAWTGKHFFPDANHRTAIAVLRNILLNRGFPPGRWSTPRSTQAIRESKIERDKREYSLDTLFIRDSHFYTWKYYFIDVLPRGLKSED